MVEFKPHKDEFSSEVYYDCVVKLVFVGSPLVGKSSIIQRFTEDSFDDNNSFTLDFKIQNITIQDTIVAVRHIN